MLRLLYLISVSILMTSCLDHPSTSLEGQESLFVISGKIGIAKGLLSLKQLSLLMMMKNRQPMQIVRGCSP